MERRKLADRRRMHVFVSDERRTGPFDRRNADARRRDRAEEMKKISEIRKFKEEEASRPVPASATTPRRKQLLVLGIVVLLLAIALFFI